MKDEINFTKMNKEILDTENTNYFTKQKYLILSELSALKEDWKWSILVVMIAPICQLFFLSFFVNRSQADVLYYIISGSIVTSLVMGTMLTLGQELGVLKEVRGFDYYSVLPIKKISIIISIVTRATLSIIPSIIVMIIIGIVYFQMPFSFNVSLILVVVISGYSLSAVGAFIGMYARDSSQASLLTQIIQPIMIYLFPVFYPINVLPTFLRWISYISPTTYVSSALRKSFIGEFDSISLIILSIFCLLSIILVEKKFDWRGYGE